MTKKLVLFVILFGLLLLAVATVSADDSDLDVDYPWRGHAPPFNFTFGNMIDSHQQTRRDADGSLHGFIYVVDIGQAADGLPIATRADCPHGPCRVGWVIQGAVIVQAELVQKGPRLWLVDPADIPDAPGYNHFQWVGGPPSPHTLEIGDVVTGYLMRRVAPAPFYWDSPGKGEGGFRLVPEGIDPHRNIVTERPIGGGHGGNCDGRDGGNTSGCDGHDGTVGGCSGDTGGCDGHDDGTDGGCSGDTGGCDGHDGTDGGCSGETGGCEGSV